MLQGRSAQRGFPGKSALRGSPICSIDNKQGDVSILAELLGIEYEKGRCRPPLGRTSYIFGRAWILNKGKMQTACAVELPTEFRRDYADDGEQRLQN